VRHKCDEVCSDEDVRLDVTEFDGMHWVVCCPQLVSVTLFAAAWTSPETADCTAVLLSVF
jgi:hypothetical protein